MAIPDQIGRYRVGPRLGSGGFAVVWSAHDDSLDTPIAIKVLAEHWADRMDLRERFLSEARMLRRASSNRVVQVYDIGELPDGRPYFVMEFADRGTLADRIAAGSLPLAQALQVSAEVARGVAELHRAGIVHRDVKPSNVLIASAADGGERLLIADLGVAKNLAQGSGLTMSVGSVGYRAPEQEVPNSGVDVRADVYSIGALAYRLITGETPGTQGHLVPPDRLVPALPVTVTKTLNHALEQDRERRWPDAAGLATRLDELAVAAGHGRSTTRRWRVAVVVAAVVLLLALSGGGLLAWNSARTVAVTDAQGRIELRVPRAWSAQLAPDGWDPAVLGLAPAAPGAPSPGLVVAGDIGRWNDLSSRVDGAFAGLGTDPALLPAVAGITHPGCTDGGVLRYEGPRFTGAIHRWTSCPGGSIAEAGLTAKDGGRPAYLQFRSSAGSGTPAGELRAVLDSLRSSS